MIAPVHLLSIAALAGLLSLCVLGSLARSGMAGIGESIRANLLTLAAFGGYALQVTAAPLWLSVLLPNALVALALCCYFTGVRRMMGRTVPRRLMALSAIAALLAVAAYTYVEPRVALRISAMSLLQTGFMLATAATVRGGMPQNRSRYAYWFVWTVAAASAAVCGLRAVLYMTGVAHTWALLEATTWNVVFLTLGLLTLPCLMLGTIMIIHDRMLAEREQEANTDFLTGLLSRKAWWLQAERYCAQALRTRRPLTLLLLDIDHFKRINDLHGHAVATPCCGTSACWRSPRCVPATMPAASGRGVRGDVSRLARRGCDGGGGRLLNRCGARLAAMAAVRSRTRSARAWPSGSRARTCNRCSSAPTASCTRRRPPGATASAGRASKPSRPSARR